jgi:hypothetical protein
MYFNKKDLANLYGNIHLQGYKSLWLKKVSSIQARKASPNEEITTLIDHSSSGALVEEKHVVDSDQDYYILSSTISNKKTESIISASNFNRLYHPTITAGTYELRQNEPKEMFEVNEDISFLNSFGKTFNLRKTGVLVPDGDGFYGINPDELLATYVSSPRPKFARDYQGYNFSAITKFTVLNMFKNDKIRLSSSNQPIVDVRFKYPTKVELTQSPPDKMESTYMERRLAAQVAIARRLIQASENDLHLSGNMIAEAFENDGHLNFEVTRNIYLNTPDEKIDNMVKFLQSIDSHVTNFVLSNHKSGRVISDDNIEALSKPEIKILNPSWVPAAVKDKINGKKSKLSSLLTQ